MARAAEDAPNIVFIIANDLGYADLSFLPYASSDVDTPNIDRLAASGVFFSNAYVTLPICSASRAGIITGRYQQRWGNYSLGISGLGLPASEMTIPEALNSAGYVMKKIGTGRRSCPRRSGYFRRLIVSGGRR